jgi:hypothetical protein
MAKNTQVRLRSFLSVRLAKFAVMCCLFLSQSLSFSLAAEQYSVKLCQNSEASNACSSNCDKVLIAEFKIDENEGTVVQKNMPINSGSPNIQKYYECTFFDDKNWSCRALGPTSVKYLLNVSLVKNRFFQRFIIFDQNNNIQAELNYCGTQIQ